MRHLVNIAAVLVGAGTVATVVFVAACWCCAKRAVWPETLDIGDEPAKDATALREALREALVTEAIRRRCCEMGPRVIEEHEDRWFYELMSDDSFADALLDWHQAGAE